MKRFQKGFGSIGLQREDPISILTGAAPMHLHFVQIQPFEDGNGRIAGAVADLAISRGFELSSPVKMSHDIFENHGAYYETLGSAGNDTMVTD